MGPFGCLFGLLLGVVLFAFVTALRLYFGMRRGLHRMMHGKDDDRKKDEARSYPRAGVYWQEGARGKDRKPVIGSDEGEYVDYEEVK